jgi:hypothetical protein
MPVLRRRKRRRRRRRYVVMVLPRVAPRCGHRPKRRGRVRLQDQRRLRRSFSLRRWSRQTRMPVVEARLQLHGRRG